MPTLNVTATNHISHARQSVSESWSTIRAGAGNDSALGSFDGTPASTYQLLLQCDTTTDKFAQLWRSAVTFDTSSIGTGKTVTSATLTVTSWKSTFRTFSYNDFEMNIYEYTGSKTSAVNADFTTYGSTALCDTPIAYASTGTWTLNAAGLAVINMTGTTAIGFRESTHDGDNSAPTWESGNAYVLWNNDNSVDRWELSVVYADAPVSSNALFMLT
jgi:hypothetical protein